MKIVPKILVINGSPTSGKSSFCTEVIAANGGLGKELSMVDFVKDIALKCGWDGTKTPENRKGLSDLKDLLADWLDTPFRNVKNKVEQLKKYCIDDGVFLTQATQIIYPIFINAREPRDIQRLCVELGARTIFIERPMDAALLKEMCSNHADLEVRNYRYDFVINNDGTYEQFKGKAKEFLRQIESEVDKNVNDD